MSVDNTDLEIIEQLNRDGRASLRKIAEKLGISPSTVSNRFQKLKENDVVQRFQPILNYEKLGYGLTAVIDLNVEAAKKEDVIPILGRKRNVISEYVVTGETDIVLVCKFLDRKDMSRFIDDLQSEDGIAQTNTNVVLESPKENGRLDLGRLKE